jgi:uncharacterized protein YneF (UPF0154 family)
VNAEVWLAIGMVVALLGGLLLGYVWGYRDRARHYK